MWKFSWTQINYGTQIWLNTVFTLATKHLIINYKNPPSTSQGLPDELSFTLLCVVIFLSLLGQINVPGSTMVNFHLDEYYWQPKFLSHTKCKQQTGQEPLENFSLKLVHDVSFPLLSYQSNIPCFIIANFHLVDYQW